MYRRPGIGDGVGLKAFAVAIIGEITHEKLENWLAEGADLTEELSNAVNANDPDRIKFLIGKGADVTEAEIEPLAGNRVHPVSGIPHQRQSQIGHVCGVVKGQRKG